MTTSAARICHLRRDRLLHGLLFLWCIYLLGALLAGCGAPETPSQGEPTQVGWGATIYRLECARCHAPGHVAPALTQERLVRYHNAQNLFAYIRQSMPLDKVGALPEQDYWDVTAYVLANANVLLIPKQTALDPKTAKQVDFTPP